jgi:hypothetical protein
MKSFEAYKWTECAEQLSSGGFSHREMVEVSRLYIVRERYKFPNRSVWLYDSSETKLDPDGVCRPIGHTIGDLHFDFDNKADLDIARNDALMTLDTLRRWHGLNLGCVRIIFTGSKGFGVIIPYQCFLQEPRDDLMYIFRSFCKHLKLSASSLDMSIYEKRRLWKLEGSRHPKTGLFRIDLSLDELQTLSIPEIKGMAEKGPRYLKRPSPSFCAQFAAEMARFKEQQVRIQVQKKNKARPSGDFSGIPIPDRIPKYLSHIQEEGTRNRAITHGIVIPLKKKGVPYSEVREIALEFNRLYCSPPLTEKEALAPLEFYFKRRI